MARIETAPGQNARRKDRMAQYVSLKQERHICINIAFEHTVWRRRSMRRIPGVL